MPDPFELFVGAGTVFGEHVHAVAHHQWIAPTPCAAWDVRALVNHVTVEDLWAVELFDGRTIEAVGGDLDGDLLGEDPARSWDGAVSAAIHAMSRPDAMTSIVHLSFGETPGAEYTMQLFADHLIHAWDLATAIGRDPGLDSDLVQACAQWFADNEAGYRQAGVIGPHVEVADDVDELTSLLAAFGRHA